MAPVNNSSKKTIFLDNHPELPKSLLKGSKVNKKSKKQQEKSETALLNWQLKWLNDYNAMRTELNKQVQEHQDEIDRLKRLMDKQTKTSSKLEDIIERKNKKIGKLKTSLHDITKSKSITSDVQVQTEADNHFQMGNCGAMGCVEFSSIRKIHSYALEQSLVKSRPRKLHKCFNCAFTTHKKSTLDNHYVYCVPDFLKEMNCPICKKSFTYHTLRTHLKYYSSSDHSSTNGHEKYTPIQHEVLLESIKLQRTHQMI